MVIIKPGVKTYRTCRGMKARLFSRTTLGIIDPEEEEIFFGYIYFLSESRPCVWDRYGKVIDGRSANQKYLNDLTGPWDDHAWKKEYDWSQLPDHIKYIAKDCRGEWRGFMIKPRDNGLGGFGSVDIQCYIASFSLRAAHYPTNAPSDLKWQDSLIARPGVEENRDI